ncbi:MAG: DUF5666 domain-containing protein [Nitrospirota bacterium]|jgi:hypothetical protein
MARLTHIFLRSGSIGLALIALIACGGGGDSDSTDVAGGGISGTGISSGPITDFGSIVVNDVHFDVTTAAITVNGTAATEDDLHLGQVVTVEFTGDTTTGRATATAVDYRRALAGPVEDVDLNGRRVRVLGQWIAADRLLAANDDDRPDVELDLEDFASDDVVEISGQFDADGVLHATRIERKGPAAPPEVEVRGVIQDLRSNTFAIRDLRVDYRGAMVHHHLAEGALVEVKGALGNAGTVIATEVDVKDDPSPVAGSPVGTEVEIEGFITEFHRFASHGELTVDQQRVRKTDSTKFKGGATADGTRLGLNVRVEVEGIVGNDGVVIATEIELDD